MDKAQYIEEIVKTLENYSGENLKGINQLNMILVSLSTAQLEYLIELAQLLFGQSAK